MRLWSLHPRYLDARGLVALWREALLARAVLRGMTRGYRRHPQLERFRSHPTPRSAVSAYLAAVHAEACSRGYAFDRSRIGPVRAVEPIGCNEGQIAHEWRHLMRKLCRRSPASYRQWRAVELPEPHPLFLVRSGGIEAWERGDRRGGATGAGRVYPQ